MVRDEDDSDALLLEPLYQFEERVDAVRVEDSGGLIEDQELRLDRNRFGDLDHLPLRDAEPANRNLWVDLDGEPLQQLAGPRAHPAVVQHAERVVQEMTQKDVFDRRKVRRERQLLMNNDDPVLQRRLRRAQNHVPSIESDRATIGAVHTSEDLDQG